MAISRFKTSTLAQGLPKYQDVWDGTTSLINPLTWSTATGATNAGAWIAFGNSTWVIGPYAGGGTYQTSSDGVSWTARTSPGGEAGGWAGSYFNLFVFGSTTVYRSTNGISWTSVSCSPAVSRGRYSGPLAIGGSRSIQAVNETFLEYATSTDGGASWGKAGASSGSGFNGNVIAYADGTWVYAGEFGNYSYSTDGLNWTNTSTPSGSYVYIFGGGGTTKFICQTPTSSTYYTSTNGISWTSRTMPASGAYAYAWTGAKWVAYPHNTATDSYYSVDGINWTAATNSMAAVGKTTTNAVSCVGGGKIVIPGYNSTTINYSLS